MRRREFVGLVGGAAAWPVAARAQRPTMPVVGLLNGQVTSTSERMLAAFRRGLAETGYVEGRNLVILYRSAEGNADQLPMLAAELVTLRVAVLASVGGDNAVRAAKNATAAIPIVFTTGGDPVETGFVSSINRPAGNITGVTFLGSLVGPKQISLLRDVVSNLTVIGLLLNPANPMIGSVEKEVLTAAGSVGLKVVSISASTATEIDAAFTQFVRQKVGAAIIGSAIFFNRNVDRLVALSVQHRIPAVFNNRDFPDGGGLMSYGADTADSYRQAGIYVGRILKGDKPADLPVMQPVRFELVINLKMAKTLGLTIPPGIVAIADEVIE